MYGKNLWSRVLAAGFALMLLISISAHSASCPDDGDRWPSMIIPTGNPIDGDFLPSDVIIPTGDNSGKGDLLPSSIAFEALT